MDEQKFVGTCEVCYYANDDLTAKPVKHCNLCGAWICQQCWGNIPLRAKAAAKRTAYNFINLFR